MVVAYSPFALLRSPSFAKLFNYTTTIPPYISCQASLLVDSFVGVGANVSRVRAELMWAS